MKHIYLINQNSTASQYGIGTYTSQLLRCLEGSGMLLTVINFEYSQEELRVSEENNVRFINIPIPYSSRQEKVYNIQLKYISFLLTYYIDSNEENIFHFNFTLHHPLAQMLKKQYPDCRILLTLHYQNWLMELKGNTDKIQSMLAKTEEERSPMEKQIISDYEQDIKFFHYADKIICLANYTRSLLCEQLMITPDKIDTIYNGLEDNCICHSQAQRNSLRKKYRIGYSEKIILFVGRVDKLKGIDVLIEAFRMTLDTIPNARLIIAGDGDYNLCFEKSTHIWTRMTFTGKIPKEQVNQLYQIAHIGVLPSFCEQCSYTAIEMMMHGLPFIGTSSTGLKEMLNNRQEDIIQLTEEDGEVLLPIDQLADKLIKHLSGPKKTDKKMYQERYLFSEMKKKMNHLYASL